MKDAPGRNDPCPCGSGRKYKQCHLPQDGERRGALARLENLGNLQTELTLEIFSSADKRFGEALDEGVFEAFFNPDDTLQLVYPYAAYHVPCEGRSAAEWFAAERGSRLSRDEQALLRAEREAWLSLWVVVESRPGEGLTLRDRLSGQERTVHERTASRSLVAGATILCRVVEIEGSGLINGLYPRSLAPIAAAEVERLARGYLRRKRDVPIERLREPKVCRYLVRRFEEAVLDVANTRPELRNNDGHPILFTFDRFEIAAGAEQQLEERILGMRGVELVESRESEDTYVVLGKKSIIRGQIVVARRALRIETNSLERADELRRRLEKACAGLVEHRARVHSDPLSAALSGEETEPEPPKHPEAQQLAREWKERHYAEWPDVPLPALGGQTPREAVRTKPGRERVAVLVDQIAHGEQRLDPAERYDVKALKRDLGLA